MNTEIPELKSRYIPVHGGLGHFEKDMHWWRHDSYFYYPYVLFNLMSFSKEQLDRIRNSAKGKMFVLTDSGGFQVVSGTCDLTWETSLLKQIELEATKIFSFDRPPTKSKLNDSLSQFIYMPESEALVVLEDNIKVALQQSNYLKEKYPEEFKKFCFIMQVKSLTQLKTNFELFDKYIGGVENFSQYFPGGIVYGLRQDDILFITMCAKHAYDNFIKKGIYVHFLGMGSFNKMIVLVRNEITTFDSSTLLQGIRVNEYVNPIHLTKTFQLSSNDLYGFNKQFCNCPVCSNIDYFELQQNNKVDIGRNCVLHNLWHLLSINTFLDAIPKEKYTQIINDNFKLNGSLITCLEFCDFADKEGFDVALEKYKPYLKKDPTKQNTLF